MQKKYEEVSLTLGVDLGGTKEETTRYLAAGLVGIINSFDPSFLALGGSVIEGLSIYLTEADLLVRRNALEIAVEGLRITTAELDNKAGTIGVATLARHNLLEDSESGE